MPDEALTRVLLLSSVSADTRTSRGVASMPGRAAKSAASRFIRGSHVQQWGLLFAELLLALLRASSVGGRLFCFVGGRQWLGHCSSSESRPGPQVSRRSLRWASRAWWGGGSGRDYRADQ